MIQSVTATDKYTVVFKSAYPTLDMITALLNSTPINSIQCPEVVQQFGSTNDWHNAVGTGPFICTDYVSGSAATYIKNPNYWGYDTPQHPGNRLPYVDIVKILIISDINTALAAVRTGKIDVIGMNTSPITWTQAEQLAKTDPEIRQVSLPYDAFCIQMRADHAPFTDIRVRQALQEAVDLQTIASEYYGGTTMGIPYPLIGPSLPGYLWPYAEWPQQLKDEYAFNVAGAKKLLADAGYPNGFNTNCVASNNSKTSDLDLLQVVKSYFNDIGVNMTIKVLDSAPFATITRNKPGVDQMVMTDRGAVTFPPLIDITQRYSTSSSNLFCVNDPVYDKMVNAVNTSIDLAAQKVLIQNCDQYADENFMVVIMPTTLIFAAIQPWLKGYDGQYQSYYNYYAARCWIDQPLKQSMVR